jgi:hypothetical protein
MSKKEASVTINVATDEAWNKIMYTAGLVGINIKKKEKKKKEKKINNSKLILVVDVYTGWWGPCKAMASAFRRIFFENEEAQLKLVTADAEKIGALSKFKGRSRPCFLFFKDGKRIDAATIVGINLPLLSSLVTTHAPPKANYTGEMIANAPAEFEATPGRPITPPAEIVALRRLELSQSVSSTDLASQLERQGSASNLSALRHSASKEALVEPEKPKEAPKAPEEGLEPEDGVVINNHEEENAGAVVGGSQS